MYRLKEDHSAELEIKKSRFICYLHKTTSEEEARAFILQVKKAHPTARHHCSAFVIGEHNEIQRSNDNGEPSGTAGIPMLECLLHRQMQDITAVTVRYFGGIKLGAGGLIRAYSKSVSNALNGARLTRKQQMLEYTLVFSYELIGKLDYFFRSHDIEVTNKEYDELVAYTFLVKEAVNEEISEITNGAYLPVFQKKIMLDADIVLPKEITEEESQIKSYDI